MLRFFQDFNLPGSLDLNLLKIYYVKSPRVIYDWLTFNLPTTTFNLELLYFSA